LGLLEGTRDADERIGRSCEGKLLRVLVTVRASSALLANRPNSVRRHDKSAPSEIGRSYIIIRKSDRLLDVPCRLPNAHGSPSLPHMCTLTTAGEPRETFMLHVQVQASTCPCSSFLCSMLPIVDGKDQMPACRRRAMMVECTVELPSKMPGRRVVEQEARRMRRGSRGLWSNGVVHVGAMARPHSRVASRG
jgi:hypothetical protein